MIDIKIRSFTGSTLKSFLPSIARLRIEVFRDYPHLDEGNLEQEITYFERYLSSKEAIGVIVFDGSTIVGASTGIPLENEIEEIQKPFLEKNLNPSSIFFFSESVLLKAYRGRGIAHHFFDLREEHVLSQKKFDHISFCCVSRPEHDPKRPKDYLPLDDFWRKRGFTLHSEICYPNIWKDLDDQVPSEKTMVFWIKDLHQIPLVKKEELKIPLLVAT